MNKSALKKSAIVATGFLAGALTLNAQSAGGAAGGGAAAGSAAAGGATVGAGSGVVSAARPGSVVSTRAGVRSAGTPAARGSSSTLHTIGAASIATPTATPAAGAESVIGTSPNTVGGTSFIAPSPGAAGQTVNATGTLPGGGATAAVQPVAIGTTPVAVQRALQGYTARGMLGSISQVQGLNGPLYQASVTQNGVPMQLEISPTGQILSQTPATGNAGIGSAGVVGTTGSGIAEAGAGMPLSSLPASLQNAITTQVGPNGQVQTISRDDLANGSVFRVTALENGVPTEMRFAANGTLLGSGPIAGTTSFVATGVPLVFSDLPATVQGAIRSQLGNSASSVTRQQGTNGTSYLVSYMQNGRPMTMVVGPDGRILSNGPLNRNTAIGRAPAATRGAGSATNSAPRQATNDTGRVSVKLDDLPDDVSRALKDKAKYSEVRYITREKRVGGDTYTIGLRNDENVGELTISADGKVLADTRRNLGEISVAKNIIDDETPQGIPFSEVPAAIQDAVKAYATASEIRSISLDLDRDGRTVYDVVYYNDGRRDRLVISKDGNVKRMEQDVSLAAEIPDPRKQPVIAVGDLPPAVRETIERQTENVRVKNIATRRVGDQTVYAVSYQTNNTPVELLVSGNGTIVRAEGAPSADRPSAPLPAPVREPQRDQVKIVNAARPPQPAALTSTNTTESTGSSAASEHGTVSSGTTAADADTPHAAVSLNDVPGPVRDAVKRVAGNSTIQSISPHLKDSGMVYEVTFGDARNKHTVLINKDGVMQPQPAATSKP